MAVCKDCSTTIYCDVNMVMLKDDLWKQACDAFLDVICDRCIERRIKRNINNEDLKLTLSIMQIPCNAMWLQEQKKRRDAIYSKAKKDIPNIQGIYKYAFDIDIELALYEIAQQANSSNTERNGAEKCVGKNIINLALELFPYAKVGEEIVRLKC